MNWKRFRRQLLDWYDPAARPMPWKNIRDPYRIWLSEIILQQTRVAQGTPYYERFTTAYPTVADLAAAPDDEVMKLWEGLGYYSRARNLLRAARRVVANHGGKFPDTYTGLRSLPGVGPYTAAAIGSFAFDLPTPVLDGNVYRILARYTGSSVPIDTTAGKKHYTTLVEEALGPASARTFNQAIMDFGATVCTPRNAACGSCPLRQNCRALAQGLVYELPRKEKKLRRRTRYFNYLVVTDAEGNGILRQRGNGDIWEGLYDFPLVESERSTLTAADLPRSDHWPAWLPGGNLSFVRSSPPYRQQLTHQTIIAVFHVFTTQKLPEPADEFKVISNKKFSIFAFPRLVNRYLEDKSLTLDLF